MEKVSISVRRGTTEADVETVLASWAIDQDARIAIRRPLRSGRDGTHWHIGGNAPGMGTVEVNFLPTSGELEVMVHDNRRGNWAGAASASLARLLRKRLSGGPR